MMRALGESGRSPGRNGGWFGWRDEEVGVLGLIRWFGIGWMVDVNDESTRVGTMVSEDCSANFFDNNCVRVFRKPWVNRGPSPDMSRGGVAMNPGRCSTCRFFQ